MSFITRQRMIFGLIVSLSLPGLAHAQLPFKIPGVDQLNLPKQSPSPKPVSPQAGPAQKSRSLEQEVQAEQARIQAQNHITIVDYSGSSMENKQGPAACLNFSKDYEGQEFSHRFTGKDFIYAHLKLSQPITDLLPAKAENDTHPKVQYYRIKLSTKVNGRSAENEIKVQGSRAFHTAYHDTHLKLAVVPDRGFFESFLEPYRTAGQFKNAIDQHKALEGLLARNFSRQLSAAYKELSPGEYKVEVSLEITAKLQGSQFVSLKDMKGVFLLAVDAEAQERYANTFNMLTQLYRDYESQDSIARQSLTEAQEKERLAQMNPRERERYRIAKRSPFGYMAAYEGKKAPINFVFGKLRKKNAYLDILWREGSCDKCEAGTSSILVTHTRQSLQVDIPVGARVSMNGRTLIPKVNGAGTVTLYWYY